ncbi:hypothetical protein [Gelidibacter japonicus]|uniref:hypothetical protein n=1 Tax=Gelidibacter japonicus TaxID=1962232 RepID=UPI002AFF9355|nr:hypothetical protein [Gelidibacter japonicus]
MATKGKKALVIGGIVLGSFLLFGYKKYDEAKKVIESLDFSIQDISHIRISLKKISFDMVIRLVNPTPIDFGATASSYISIQEIRVYSQKGEYLGVAKSNIHQIQLPAHSQFDLPKISINLDSIKALQEFMNNPAMYINKDFSQLKYQIDISAFGNVITLDA